MSSWKSKLIGVERTLGTLESRGRRLAEVELLRPFYQAMMALSLCGNTFGWADAADVDGRVGGDGPFKGVYVESAYHCFLYADSIADGLDRLRRVKEIEDAWRPEARSESNPKRARKARRKGR